MSPPDEERQIFETCFFKNLLFFRRVFLKSFPTFGKSLEFLFYLFSVFCYTYSGFFVIPIREFLLYLFLEFLLYLSSISLVVHEKISPKMDRS